MLMSQLFNCTLVPINVGNIKLAYTYIIYRYVYIYICIWAVALAVRWGPGSTAAVGLAPSAPRPELAQVVCSQRVAYVAKPPGEWGAASQGNACLHDPSSL